MKSQKLFVSLCPSYHLFKNPVCGQMFSWPHCVLFYLSISFPEQNVFVNINVKLLFSLHFFFSRFQMIAFYWFTSFCMFVSFHIEICCIYKVKLPLWRKDSLQYLYNSVRIPLSLVISSAIQVAISFANKPKSTLH